MAISVADNFSYKGSKPLDARVKYSTVADMKNATASDLYDGCFAYVTATKKYYSYDSSNTVDETTGKWREYSSGGSGGGHVIEDNGTELTQRDTLNLIGFDAEDDSQNEKTQVSAHRLTSSEIEEIFSVGLPGAITGFDLSNTSNEANIHSTDERVIGQWTDGKPLYQKTVTGTILTNNWSEISHSISNVDTIFITKGFVKSTSGATRCIGGAAVTNTEQLLGAVDSQKVYIYNMDSTSNYTTAIVTLQYTKTTDSAVASGEKIVGQWVDGKPIFEKVFEIPALPSNTTAVEYNPQISNFGEWIVSQCSASITFASGNKGVLPYFNYQVTGVKAITLQYQTTGAIQVTTGQDRSDCSATFILHYTKS